MAPLSNFRNIARTPEKNLNWGHPLLHIVSSAHEVWLICNYDFRSEEKKNNSMKIGRHKHPCYLDFFLGGGGGGGTGEE